MAILEKSEVTTLPLKERTSKAIENVETKVALFGSRAQVKFLKACNETREQIHRHPITSVLVGAGAGILIGGLTTFLFTRKSGT